MRVIAVTVWECGELEEEGGVCEAWEVYQLFRTSERCEVWLMEGQVVEEGV